MADTLTLQIQHGESDNKISKREYLVSLLSLTRSPSLYLFLLLLECFLLSLSKPHLLTLVSQTGK